jgi:hypothetical protein
MEGEQPMTGVAVAVLLVNGHVVALEWLHHGEAQETVRLRCRRTCEEVT